MNMKKTLTLIITLSFLLNLASCGNKKNKKNIEALNASYDSNLQALEIRNKYGIRTETDLEAYLESVKTDLRDSGLHFSAVYKAKSRPVYEGDKWNAKKIARKTKRAWKRAKKNRKTPKGMVWKEVIDKCEDLVLNLDYAPEDAYGQTNVGKTLREYYEVAQLYLKETRKDQFNCEFYSEVEQAQQQIARNFLHAAPRQDSLQERTVIDEGIK